MAINFIEDVTITGAVGIGTAPAAGVELHVNGDIRVDATDGVATRKIRSGYFSTTTDIRVESGSAGDVILGDSAAARLTLASDDSATFAGTISSGAITSSASIIANGNSNSFGNTTIAALSATSGTFSASVTASGNSNSFGNTTTGSLTASISADSDSTYTGIVVSESGLLKYRTKAQIRSDIGAGTGSGNVSSSGTPADNYVAVWTNSSTIEGTSDFQWNGSLLTVNGEGRFYDNLILNDGVGTSPPLQFITGAGDIWQMYNHSSNGLSFQNSTTGS